MRARGTAGWLAAGMLAAGVLTGCFPVQAPAPTATVVAALPTPTELVFLTPTALPTLTATRALPTLTPSVTPPPAHDDPGYFYGGLVVTMNDVGGTITLKYRENFLLVLGDGFNWTVTVAPETVISRNLMITPEPGNQGVYVARGRGRAALRAVGEPQCRFLQPACAHPEVLFTAEIVVE